MLYLFRWFIWKSEPLYPSDVNSRKFQREMDFLYNTQWYVKKAKVVKGTSISIRVWSFFKENLT